MCADVWRVRTWRHKKVSASPLPNNFSNLQTINDMWTGGGPMTASYISPLLYLCSAFERSLMDCQRKRGLVVPRKCSKPNPSENLNVSRPRRRKSKKRRLGEKKEFSFYLNSVRRVLASAVDGCFYKTPIWVWGTGNFYFVLEIRIFVKCFYLRFTFLSITGPTCCVEVFSLTGVRSTCVATMFDLTVSHLLPNRGHPC